MKIEQQVHESFGTRASVEGPLAASGAGLRIVGIDLNEPLSPDKVNCLLDALSQYRILSLPGQDLASFSLDRFERFANHWGAPLPHPSNYRRNGELRPLDQRVTASVNAAHPTDVKCLPHESPAVLIAANIRGHDSEGDRQALRKVIEGGDCWHTDIEYEQIPLWVSMFLAHTVPVSRNTGGYWASEHPWNETKESCPYIEGSSNELMHLRRQLPRNGETPFADTAAAFAAMSNSEQARLSSVNVIRRIDPSDEGWLVPLVRTNPRSGMKSLHSPVWASRPMSRPPVEVQGMSAEASRAFLDELETHVLQPEFRYDHPHEPGAVTIWDLFMTLHSFPWLNGDVKSVDDVRLLYRISCKGEPSLTLPRNDAPEWLSRHITSGYQTPCELY